MALAPGARLGPYVIAAPIGAGGMGEVYRATDTNLKRAVAIKVLPESVAADRDRLARFQREAEVLASLNHPNIAAIYGLEDSTNTKALVMELVEGPTLADRIAQGPIPVEEALLIARQIAEALEAAHEQGIIHRDFKPANIKVRADGTVKVLDFGLAKALEPVSARVDATASPTITSPAMMTGVGVLLGTAAYMSPEQARGKPVDKRTDIWAFGCVLYEMLTGRRAFEGQEVADVLARILERDPDFNALPVTVPSAVRRLLRRSLQKNPKDRLAAAADARLDLEEVLADRGSSVDAVEHVQVRRRRVLAYGAAVLAGAALVAVAVALALRSTTRTDDARVFTSSILPPVNTQFGFTAASPAGSMAVAPDGRHVAFLAAGDDGVQRVWIRNLETGASRMLPGTDNADRPFWSADSESVGFIVFPGRQIKTADLRGGAPFTVGELVGEAARAVPAWSREGIILFTGGVGGPIYRISASGGASSPVTTIDTSRGETEHWYPVFLPDGRHFLFLAIGNRTNPLEPNGIFVGSLDSPDRTLLVPGGSNPQYANGHLLFLRGQTLFAQPFDPATLELSGSPRPLAEEVSTGGSGGRTGAFSASDTVLVYRTGRAGLVSRLAWYDRTGRRIGFLGDEAEYTELDLSPDGSRLAVGIIDQVSRTRDLWRYDVERGVRSRVTSMPGDEGAPVWMPGGGEILFTGFGDAMPGWDIYRSGGAAAAGEPILADARRKLPSDVTHDNRLALLTVFSGGDIISGEIWALPLGGGTPFPVLQDPARGGEARFSPDGRWIAYHGSEARPSRAEVYIMPFGRAGERIPVTSAGGVWPRWNGDGTELFYAGPNNEVIAVAVSLSGSAVRIGTPRTLFEARPKPATPRWFDVSSDGQRFVVNELPEEIGSAPLTMVVNWAALVKP